MINGFIFFIFCIMFKSYLSYQQESKRKGKTHLLEHSKTGEIGKPAPKPGQASSTASSSAPASASAPAAHVTGEGELILRKQTDNHFNLNNHFTGLA